MSDPREAQIEAVVLWMEEHSYTTEHGDTVERLLVELEAQAKERGSLQKWLDDQRTAAAQVGEIAPCDDAEFGTYDHRMNDPKAAAQVGEPTMDEKLEQWDEWYKTLPANLKAKLSISDFRRLGDNFYRIFVLQKPAAAQVGEPMTKRTEKDLAGMIMDADLPKRLEQELENRTYQLNHALLDIKELKAELAAARVGEPTESERWQAVANQGIHIETQLRKELLTIEANTIERCKQVALNCELTDERHAIKVRQQIAAAIGRLKDEA